MFIYTNPEVFTSGFFMGLVFGISFFESTSHLRGPHPNRFGPQEKSIVIKKKTAIFFILILFYKLQL